MARNSTGTYTKAVPSFTTGTVIDSGDMNSQFDDLATEMTDSLSRSGKGGMTARLRGVDGTSALPAYAFTAETTLGFYRAASGDLRASSNGTDIAKWTTTGVTVYQAGIYEKGLTVTNSTTNGAGVTATGNGTGAGVVATGGSGGNGVTGAGTGAGHGGVFTGGSSGADGVRGTGAGSGGVGGRFTGSTSGTGDGVIAIAGTGSNGRGVNALGAAGQAGGLFTPGTSATAGNRQSAIILNGGDLAFQSTTNPDGDVAFTNTLTPFNIPKAAIFVSALIGNLTVHDTFNISSATPPAISGGDLVITFASAFANDNYIVQLTTDATNGVPSPAKYVVWSRTTTAVTIRGLTTSDTQESWGNGTHGLNITVLGRQ